MLNNNDVFRHGDVLIIKIDDLDISLIKKDNVVAYGEVTGHSHRIIGNAQVLYHPITNVQFVHVKEKSQIVHQEHDTIDLPVGDYEIRIQREFDLIEGIRRVMD